MSHWGFLALNKTLVFYLCCYIVVCIVEYNNIKKRAVVGLSSLAHSADPVWSRHISSAGRVIIAWQREKEMCASEEQKRAGL